MPPSPLDLVGGSREVCRGIAMCFCWSCVAGVARLACLLAFPSLPPTKEKIGVSINSTHWFFLFSVVLTGAWRWAVARLPWWPPYCWGVCCPPLLLPFRHLPSNIQLAWSLICHAVFFTETLDLFQGLTIFLYENWEAQCYNGLCVSSPDWSLLRIITLSSWTWHLILSTCVC